MKYVVYHKICFLLPKTNKQEMANLKLRIYTPACKTSVNNFESVMCCLVLGCFSSGWAFGHKSGPGQRQGQLNCAIMASISSHPGLRPKCSWQQVHIATARFSYDGMFKSLAPYVKYIHVVRSSGL